MGFLNKLGIGLGTQTAREGARSIAGERSTHNGNGSVVAVGANRPPEPQETTRGSNGLKEFLWNLDGLGRGTLLDLGPAWQTTLTFFIERGFRVTSDDILRDWSQFLAEEEAKAKAKENVTADDYAERTPEARAKRFLEENLQYPAASFDALLRWLQVVQYVPKQQCVERSRRVLQIFLQETLGSRFRRPLGVVISRDILFCLCFGFFFRQKLRPVTKDVVRRNPKAPLDEKSQRGLPRRAQIEQSAAPEAIQIPKKFLQPIRTPRSFLRFRRTICPDRHHRAVPIVTASFSGDRPGALARGLRAKPNSQFVQESHVFSPPPLTPHPGQISLRWCPHPSALRCQISSAMDCPRAAKALSRLPPFRGFPLHLLWH